MLTQVASGRIIRVLDSRMSFLQALQTEPLEKRDLVDALDVSRSTVNRGLRELLDLGLVRYSPDEGYSITLCGRLIADQYRQLRTRIDAISDVQDLLMALPPDCPIDPLVVETGTVVRADKAAPHHPGTFVSEQVTRADRCWGLSRAHSYHGALDLFSEQVLQQGMEAEVVLHVDLYDYLVETATDAFRQLCAADGYQAHVIDYLPYGLFVLEHESSMSVNLLVYGEGNQLVGVLSSETPEAVRWGHRVFARCRADADRVEID